MADARRILSKSICDLSSEILLYACKIKETTDGCWRCACSEARQAFEVVAQGGFAEHVQVDGPSRAAQNGEDQAQGKADKKEAALRVLGAGAEMVPDDDENHRGCEDKCGDGIDFRSNAAA